MHGFSLFLAIGVVATVGLMLGTIVYGMRGGRRTTLGLGLSLVLLGLLFALAMGRTQGRLVLFGAHAEGQIVEMNRAGKAYKPVVEFTTADETTITFDGTTVAERDDYMIWQKVPVRYLPDDPQVAEIQSWQSLWQPLLIGTICIAAILACGFILLWRDVIAHRIVRIRV